jgi:hypothetical protein
MKKVLLALLIALTAIGVSHAETVDLYTCLFGSGYNQKNANNYSTEWTAINNGFTWKLVNLSNGGSNNWSVVKCGHNTNAITATITTATAMPEAISSVVVNVSEIVEKEKEKIKSFKLETSKDDKFESINETVDELSSLKVGDVEFTLKESAKELYYRITIETEAGSSNGFLSISKIVYRGETSAKPEKPSFTINDKTVEDNNITEFPGTKVVVTSKYATSILDGDEEVEKSSDTYSFELPDENKTFTFKGYNGNGYGEVATLNYTVKAPENLVITIGGVAVTNTYSMYEGDIVTVTLSADGATSYLLDDVALESNSCQITTLGAHKFVAKNAGGTDESTITFTEAESVAYVQVYNVEQLNTTDRYIIATSSVNKAISNVEQTNYREAVDVTINDKLLVNPFNSVMTFKLSGDNESGWKWIAENYKEQSNQGLRFSTASGSTNITMNTSPSVTNVTIGAETNAVISGADVTESRQLLYYKTSNRFANYNSSKSSEEGAYAPVRIYRQVGACQNDLSNITVASGSEIAIKGPVNVLIVIGSNVWLEDESGNRFFAKVGKYAQFPSNVTLGKTFANFVLTVDKVYDLTADTKYYEGTIVTEPSVDDNEDANTNGFDVTSVDRSNCGKWVRMQGKVVFETANTGTFTVSGKDYKLRNINAEGTVSSQNANVPARVSAKAATTTWSVDANWPVGETYDNVYVAAMVAPEGEEDVVLYPYVIAEDKTLTGVDDIDVNDSESTVTVVGNAIIAPEGSRIYNVSGARVAASNYATGLYIVALPNGTVRKVLIH